MEDLGIRVAVATLAALSLVACNRSRVASPAPGTSASTRPAQQAAKPSSSSNLTPAVSTPAAAANTVEAAAPKSETASSNLVSSDQSESLVVAGRTFRFLAHIQSIPGTSERTTEWWELRDADDHVVYRESYPVAVQNGAFESTVDVNASAFTAKGGSGIFISGMDLPSDPESGGWLRVFGFKYGRDKYGADSTLFGPFGPAIVIEGEFLGVGSDPTRPNMVSLGGATQVPMDILKFRLWTGHFNIVYPVQINWISGSLQPEWRCPQGTSEERVDRCSYPITVEGLPRSEPTFVRLFPEADDSAPPKHVVVQPQSKVEYLEASVPVVWSGDANTIGFSVNGDMWVKVRIDGVEGWIHSDEDFEAIGLPEAG